MKEFYKVVSCFLLLRKVKGYNLTKPVVSLPLQMLDALIVSLHLTLYLSTIATSTMLGV